MSFEPFYLAEYNFAVKKIFWLKLINITLSNAWLLNTSKLFNYVCIFFSLIIFTFFSGVGKEGNSS